MKQANKKRIIVHNSRFYRNGERIWFNGANTPWFSWNDFGGSFDENLWKAHFCALEAIHVNACRVWICCDGDVGIQINQDGFITGATQKHWDDLDKLMEIAEEHNIYIMASVMSFDHFKDSHETYESWRKLIRDNDKVDSFCHHYLKPLVNRYKSNPYFWSIDLMNEPDWVTGRSFGYIKWEYLCNYFARASIAVHESSPVHVTVGVGMIDNLSDDVAGNKISDHMLRQFVDSPLAVIDFYSPHYYPGHKNWLNAPFENEPAAFGLSDTKPCVIGECKAKSSVDSTLSEDYINAYKNNWDGVFAWTSNGVDVCGGFNEVSLGTNSLKRFIDNQYAGIVCSIK